MEIKNYVQDIADQRFSAIESYTSSGPIKIKDKAVDPFSFSSQGIYPQPPSAPYHYAKEDVTVIFRRRGGDDLVQSHNHWTKTVSLAPDVIEMTFLPIISLLDGIHGKDHLTRSINLYLEYKPPIEELRYFSEFQVPRIWAPVRENFPGHQRKEPVCPSLQFSIMGQKLYVSQEQPRAEIPNVGIGQHRVSVGFGSGHAKLYRYRLYWIGFSWAEACHWT
ncbi:MACPF domain-containing protein CAD1-like [Iris pallida]|uniref:MACPF domain-containing protein CAD1-like n=1 Tax=Iris pallida TaxID=29817 RepID=A0AAX6EIG0_IRIPA|nr:MACPF domain-containing protein CAD1-like [Iris pallida]